MAHALALGIWAADAGAYYANSKISETQTQWRQLYTDLLHKGVAACLPVRETLLSSLMLLQKLAGNWHRPTFAPPAKSALALEFLSMELATA